MATDTTLPAHPPDTAESRRRLYTALLVAAAFFMENLDGTIITTAVPAMARDFGVLPIDLNPGVSAYLLTLGIFIPISGWVADRFGPRRIFASAIVIFTLASLACGMADSLGMFVALRVLQGIGGAMMVPVGRLVVLRSTPKHQLVGAIAILTWPALVAPVLGPPIGGFITTYASWRWIFYLNLPIGLAALAAAWVLIPNDRAATRRPFDWAGFFWIGSGLFCVLWALEHFGKSTLDWSAIGVWAVLGSLLLASGVRHLHRTPHPMLSLAALRIPTFAVTCWGGSLFRMSVGAVPFLLPLMFQVGYGMDAFHAGLLVIAVFAGNLLMKVYTTRVLRRFGFRPTLLVNGLINALALMACAFIGPDTPVAATAVLLFVGGMARSMQFTALNTLAFADVPQEGMSAANTLFSTVFQLAIGMGVALGAVSIRLGEWAAPFLHLQDLPGIPFRLAFVAVGLVALLGLADSLALARGAGEHVARPQPR
ncbi:MFS transporter [Bordetella genomosp. 1]|uniref:MFS transporter n=1 Tax=Bordetella genomosp. 1 TaxID=1395607 RepID=A0ABX4EYI0_9BORD|nr:MFS transporter [Bordetella genomosp. 1]OZI64136.1 MFS transporter [Bordetella genomosp. 1]